jgi:hypothetical protein
MIERREHIHPQCLNKKCNSLCTCYVFVGEVLSVVCTDCGELYVAQRKADAAIAEKRRLNDIVGCGQ